MKIIKINNDLFKAHLSWFTKCTEDEYFNKLIEFGFTINKEERSGSNGHCDTKIPYRAIWVNPKLKPAEYLRILNHEILHYCIAVMVTKGIPVNENNDEVIAYMQQHILEQCMAINLKAK